MPLPAPQFAMVHGVLQLPMPLARDPARDEIFVQAVRSEFPNVVTRQYLPTETPAAAPHLVLTSTSSQLALSSVQADFEVRFYGDYVEDVERGIEYVVRKLSVVLGGFAAVDLRPMIVGLIGTVRFPFSEEGPRPVEHVLATHLRAGLDSADVQDAMARVALRVRDTYFVTLTVSNYESRVLERPLFPGVNMVAIRPWEGRLDEVGIELGVDINNALEARESNEPVVVTDAGLTAVTNLLREVVTNAGAAFVESGAVSVEEITASSAV